MMTTGMNTMTTTTHTKDSWMMKTRGMTIEDTEAGIGAKVIQEYGAEYAQKVLYENAMGLILS